MERVNGSIRDMSISGAQIAMYDTSGTDSGRLRWSACYAPNFHWNFYLHCTFFRTCTVLVLFSFFCRALCSSQAASADGLLSGQVHHPEALHQHHLITWEQYLATPTPTDESLPANIPSCPGININQSYLLVLGFRKKGPFFRRVNCIMIDWWILVVCEIHL